MRKKVPRTLSLSQSWDKSICSSMTPMNTGKMFKGGEWVGKKKQMTVSKKKKKQFKRLEL